ncbi:MAG TPA: hypothetical protein VF572_05320 [Candidatus Saccharimonadales bacterium]|jgi:hypothetical protein
MAKYSNSAELPKGYESLTGAFTSDDIFEGMDFTPNAAYEDYLKMHKVIVGPRGAERLEDIFETLSNETMPRYLAAAGWAAAEAALVLNDRPVEDRMEMLEAGVDCWSRAVEAQQQMNDSCVPYLDEPAYPHRLALDIACAPLFAGVIQGEWDPEVGIEVFEDCLNIAQDNAVQLNLAAREGNFEGVAAHVGLGYECNALLAFNKTQSEDWFVAPSTVRSDSGYHHPKQTHDLQVVQHFGGELQSVTPVEIKASASARDRNRFRALLVRGKMHLSVEGKFTPEATLEAIAASYEGNATDEEMLIDECIGERVIDMILRYRAGAAISDLGTGRSVTVFHEGDKVSEKYMGILRAS